MRFISLFLTAFLSTSLLSMAGCAPRGSDVPSKEELMANHSRALNDWFEERFDDELARSPMSQTYLGQKGAADRLDDVSQLALDESAALQKAWLEQMRQRFDIDRLDAQTALSYRLYEYAAQDALKAHEMQSSAYVFQHMSGPHSDWPSFMINFHGVETKTDAQDYIARLIAVQNYMGQFSARAQAQAEAGVLLPRFVYDKVSQSCRNVITGAPFTEGEEESPLFKDFKAKVNALDLTREEKAELIEQAQEALLSSVQPAYLDLLAMLQNHKAKAKKDDGVWKLPSGDKYYAARLAHYTTTDMSAEDIHALGLKEVARIQDEMRKIMKQVEFDGSLQEFFTFLRTDPQFTFPNTDAGRDSYITEATAIIDQMKAQSDGLFITKPKADMVVKRVEPFREDTAFGAFYDQPALDGSRPGTYYINLRDVKEQPTYLMQALAYHEGIPGHHMQIAIGMELEGLPKFRTLGGHTSYIEGWALYAEALPAELGLYTDPYKDFGRLSMEIFRAARLVVDTGIHAKKWTREQAVDYYLENIANPEGDIRAEIDRYIVWPGQATAYKIGMLKIQALRAQAETTLGERFDIREFHDVILANGSVPLTILEELVNQWVSEKQKA